MRYLLLFLFCFFIAFVFAQQPRLVLPTEFIGCEDKVIISNDEKLIATISNGYPGHGDVRIWDVRTKEKLTHIQAKSSQYNMAKFTLDGKKVVVGGTGFVEKWDISKDLKLWEHQMGY